MTSEQLPRIFVQIASYRDPECHHTLTDLFTKAASPERVFVGVCWQYDPESDMDYLNVPFPRAEQVQVIQYHIRDAKGAGWARMEAQKLWRGEDYILQIQAHHRFEPGWDKTLIELLLRYPSPKTVLTAWLPTYTPPDNKPDLKGELPISTVNYLGQGNDAQLIHLIKRMLPAGLLYNKMLPTPMWVGNFMFTRSQTLQEVPFDPYIYFWGEEPNYSARLFTHGYDIFHLDRLVLYHYWDRTAVKDAAIYRDFGIRRNQLSLMRNQHLLGLKPATDEEALIDIEKYALGTARKLEDFWTYLGVDLPAHTVTMKARLGEWTMEDVPPAQRSEKNAPRIFVAIASYRDPEITHTIADLFEKAANPDRIAIGICLQIDEKEDAACTITSNRMPQIRIKQVPYTESQGANWARAGAMALQNGEDYILQIDSHMRFEQGWDQLLIDMLARCPSARPLLSTYLPNYDPPNKRDYHHGHLLRIRVRKFGSGEDPQLLHITGQFVPNGEKERMGLYPSPFIAANFMFAKAALFVTIPIDPHFHFYGDEISYSARLWTHGVDIFQPDRVVMFHYWVRKDLLHLHHYRNTKTEASKRSEKRVNHLLGFKKTKDKEALKDIAKYGLGSVRTLEDLWTFAGIDWKNETISPDALEGKWNLTARQNSVILNASEGSLPGSFAYAQNDNKKRIFIQIASYRDPDCQRTVKDLFDKAAHPERLFVGICWQTVKGEDDHCFQVPYSYPDQVRVHEADAKTGRGVCWARSLTQALYQGEEFTLQIDSHMRFEPGWDETLIRMWNDCDSENAVITLYPPGFIPPDDRQRGWTYGMAAKEFDKDGIFLMKSAPSFKANDLPTRPIPGAFASACMLFGPGRIIADVPYDPHLYFFGEEISLAVRLWTSGYDFYHPNKIFIFHDWDRSKRPTHFTDHTDWSKRNDIAFARVKHLLGTQRSTNPDVLQEIDKYGLGMVRSLAEYQAHSGVDFAAKTFSEKAASGIFQAPKKSPEKSRIFVQIASYRDLECQWTVKDLFEKAKYPDRISVGICWQFDAEADKDCFLISTRPDQVRMMPVDWRDTDGVCWARNLTQLLWEGEDYTLQIDSHMRFVPGWDELMIAELAACDSEKPVLSCSPASYTPPNDLEKHPLPTIRRVLPFSPEGNLRGRGEHVDRMPSSPLNAAFLAAGFVFSHSSIIEEVPYDPYLYFDQEEITYAARLYTHGWDIFSSRKPLLYHYYNVAGRDSARPLHWSDLRESNPDKLRALRERGMKRFNHLTGHKQSDDLDAIKELAKYGFGRARTLEQYQDYSGVDFKNKVASEKALRCQFIKDLGKYRDKPVYVPELDGGGMPLNPPTTPIISLLEAGDFVPLFWVDDTNLKSRAMEAHGGRFCMVAFLPAANPDYTAQFFKSFKEQMARAGNMEIWSMFFIDDTVANLVALKEKHSIPETLSADPDRSIARAFGVAKPEQQTFAPVGFLLNKNLRVIERFTNLTAAQLAEQLVTNCKAQFDAFKQKDRQVITAIPPALIVPKAFTPEFCKKLIDAFKSGHTFDGTVGARGDKSYRPDAKLRTDFVVQGELLRQVDDKLSRSLFPEIKKIFGFDVTRREHYKIGLYEGDKGGFFRQHRDNFDAPLGYRRIALTLHLNEDYEGGGLRFPEYDSNIYKTGVGGAIAFSCSTLHEALPVTKGGRYVLVGFFHGEEEEAYRRHYAQSKGEPLKIEAFTPTIREYPGLKLSREFYNEWQDKNVRYNTPTDTGNPMTKTNLVITSGGAHTPKKVLETKQAIVYDDFLPEDVYERILAFATKTDYEHINTKGKIGRAWHLHDGFPLRSILNLFYYAEGTQKPQGDYVYPTKTDMDIFMDHLLKIQPEVEHFVGKQGSEWAHVTATNWVYPAGTGLSMHDDGSGVYTGAFAYFLNPTWRLHWGGLNLMIEDEGNQLVYDQRAGGDETDYYKRKWLHANATDELLMEHGFARAIFPKRNRIVFIANNAYHMVTRVNEAAGDNHRMSIAGFYNRKKQNNK